MPDLQTIEPMKPWDGFPEVHAGGQSEAEGGPTDSDEPYPFVGGSGESGTSAALALRFGQGVPLDPAKYGEFYPTNPNLRQQPELTGTQKFWQDTLLKAPPEKHDIKTPILPPPVKSPAEEWNPKIQQAMTRSTWPGGGTPLLPAPLGTETFDPMSTKAPPLKSTGTPQPGQVPVQGQTYPILNVSNDLTWDHFPEV